jgi:hypothetical protein
MYAICPNDPHPDLTVSATESLNTPHKAFGIEILIAEHRRVDAKGQWLEMDPALRQPSLWRNYHQTDDWVCLTCQAKAILQS